MKVSFDDVLLVDFVGFDFFEVSLGTYDSVGNELEFVDSAGYWHKKTYNSDGVALTCVSSAGCWTYGDYGVFI